MLAFELPFFRATGETTCGCVHPELELPRAEHVVDLDLAPTLIVPREGPPRLDGRRMDPATLEADLLTLRRNWSIIHPGQPVPASLLVFADAETEWGELRPLLAAAARAGYTHPDFVVQVEDVEVGAGFDWDRFR